MQEIPILCLQEAHLSKQIWWRRLLSWGLVFDFFSVSFASYWVQLSLTLPAYSIKGWIKEKYIVSNEFLSSENFGIRITFTRNQAFD